MLDAMTRGNGSMAQFNHPEFSGSGQWMRGGMTMVSDMFNDALKRRINALCSDLAELLSSSAAGSGSSDAAEGKAAGPATAPQSSASGAPRDGWPPELGKPSASGSQNDVRYAYFADARRLAVDQGGKVTIYDTGEHRIGGVSQQQSGSATMRFTSQHGDVDLASLPVVPPAKG